ncbi:NAD-dependent epimerase/dehydratase family protein, partial [Candidatus Bathyarchaeota archaeon]|nr:NAD-dependent epimerase/dehydratase family protein [Candidatus Bathyarchaeota archaeon]
MSGKIFVSGGAGFIGSHLVDALVRAGFEVNVLDDLSSGSMEHIRGHIDGRRVRFVRGDVRDGCILRGVLKDCEVVFHLAAVTSVPF